MNVDTASIPLIIVTCVLYLTSHVVRAARLYLLAFEVREMGMKLVTAHFATAWLNVILPFKIGEFLRIGAFAAVSKKPVHGPAIWFIERLCDALVLSALLIAVGFVWTLPDSAQLFLVALIVFILLVGMVIWASTELSAYLQDYLLLKSRSRRGLALLKALMYYLDAAAEVRLLLFGRLPAVLALTVVIWWFELLAIATTVSTFTDGRATVFALLDKLTAPQTLLMSYESMVLFVLSIFSGLVLLNLFIRSRHATR